MRLFAYAKLMSVLFFLFIITSCTGMESAQDQSVFKDHSFNGVVPVSVDDIPDNYISIYSVAEELEGIVSVGFFESQVYVLDSNENNLFQTSIDDQSFMIQYKDDIYINKSKLEELISNMQEDK